MILCLHGFGINIGVDLPPPSNCYFIRAICTEAFMSYDGLPLTTE